MQISDIEVDTRTKIFALVGSDSRFYQTFSICATTLPLYIEPLDILYPMDRLTRSMVSDPGGMTVSYYIDSDFMSG